MAISLCAASTGLSEADQGIEMQLSSEIQFEEKVKIFDYEGNLLKEYLLTDVVNNNISITDHFTLKESHFAFDYLGDYYYFSEEVAIMGAN